MNNRYNRQRELLKLTSPIISIGSNAFTRFWSAISNDKYMAGPDNARDRKYRKTIMSMLISIKNQYNDLESEALKSGDEALFFSARMLDKITNELELVKTNIAGFEKNDIQHIDNEDMSDLYEHIRNILFDVNKNKKDLSSEYSRYVDKLTTLKDIFDHGSDFNSGAKNKKVSTAYSILSTYNDLTSLLRERTGGFGDTIGEILFSARESEYSEPPKTSGDNDREKNENPSEEFILSKVKANPPKNAPKPSPRNLQQKDVVNSSEKKKVKTDFDINKVIQDIKNNIDDVPEGDIEILFAKSVIKGILDNPDGISDAMQLDLKKEYKKLLTTLNKIYGTSAITIGEVIDSPMFKESSLGSNILGLKKVAIPIKVLKRLKNKFLSEKSSAIKLEIADLAKTNKKIIDESMNILEKVLDVDELNISIKEVSKNNAHIRRLILPFLKNKDFSQQFADMINNNKIMNYDRLSEAELRRLQRSMELKKIRDLSKIYNGPQ